MRDLFPVPLDVLFSVTLDVATLLSYLIHSSGTVYVSVELRSVENTVKLVFMS